MWVGERSGLDGVWTERGRGRGYALEGKISVGHGVDEIERRDAGCGRGEGERDVCCCCRCCLFVCCFLSLPLVVFITAPGAGRMSE